jgi:hypothetical protein
MNATTSTDTLDILSAHNTLPQLGCAFWWTLPEMTIPFTDVMQAATEHGLPADIMPKPIRTKTAFLRTMYALQNETRFVRKIVDDQEHVIFAIIRETKHEQDVEFTKDDLVVLDKKTLSISYTVGALTKEVEALLDTYRDVFIADDLRRLLINGLRSAHAIMLRPTGGVYFVPTPSYPLLDRLCQFVNRLNPNASMTRLGIVDTEQVKATIFQRVQEEIQTYVERAEHELRELLNNPTTKASTMHHRIESFNAARKKLELYETLLDGHAESIRLRLHRLIEQAQQVLLDGTA